MLNECLIYFEMSRAKPKMPASNHMTYYYLIFYGYVINLEFTDNMPYPI